MRTDAVAYPFRTSAALSAVLRAVGLSILGSIGWAWFVSADDSAWKADPLVAAVALTAAVGGTWCLRRARTARRWRAALDLYAEKDLAKGTRSRKGSHARPQPEGPAPPLQEPVRSGAVLQRSYDS
jgi:hypothetical protein